MSAWSIGNKTCREKSEERLRMAWDGEWRGERGERGTGIGCRGYGMIDGSRVWSGNCEGQETEEMTWEVGHGLWEIMYRKKNGR